jgi:CheY-like chemotaxis protein
MTNQIKVLCIDDEPEITEVLKEYFSNRGHQCFTENSAKEGLIKAKSALPDAIIVDVVMPEMNGLEVCSMLKKDKETRNIPVILLSGKAGDYTIDEIYQSGCELLVKKPFSCERLIEIVKSFTVNLKK